MTGTTITLPALKMPSQVAAQLEIWASFHERHESC
jgi:hypothetical protein